MQKSTTVALSSAAGAVLSTLIVWSLWEKTHRKSKQEMHRVGVVRELICYPITGLKHISVQELEFTNHGLQCPWLGNGVLSIVDSTGKSVGSFEIPRMLLINLSLSGTILTFETLDRSSISVDLEQEYMNSLNHPDAPYDCGKQIERWLSQLLDSTDTGYRLVFNRRTVRPQQHFIDSSILLYTDHADKMNFNLQNLASIKDLNEKLDASDHVAASNIETNILVGGAKPYDEDNWDNIIIGHVLFKNIKPCVVSVFWKIDPKNGVTCVKKKHLEILKSYRNYHDYPVLGRYIILRNEGSCIIKVGDHIYATYKGNLKVNNTKA